MHAHLLVGGGVHIHLILPQHSATPSFTSRGSSSQVAVQWWSSKTSSMTASKAVAFMASVTMGTARNSMSSLSSGPPGPPMWGLADAEAAAGKGVGGQRHAGGEEGEAEASSRKGGGGAEATSVGKCEWHQKVTKRAPWTHRKDPHTPPIHTLACQQEQTPYQPRCV